MSQQVNLFNPALVKAKDWFSLRTVALIYLVVVCAMCLFYRLLSQKIEAIQIQRNQVVTTFEANQKKLSVLSSQQSTVVNSKEDEVMVSYLQQKMDSQAKVIEMFKSVQSGEQAHVSDYLRGLAHLSPSNLWITGLKLEPFKKHVTLQGRAMSPDLVPIYIQQLGQEPVFSGQLFDGLKLTEIEQQVQLKPTASAIVRSDATPVTAPVVNATTMAPLPVANVANKNPAVTTKIVAFEIVGMDMDAEVKGKAQSNQPLERSTAGGAN